MGHLPDTFLLIVKGAKFLFSLVLWDGDKFKDKVKRMNIWEDGLDLVTTTHCPWVLSHWAISHPIVHGQPFYLKLLK